MGFEGRVAWTDLSPYWELWFGKPNSSFTSPVPRLFLLLSKLYVIIQLIFRQVQILHIAII